MGAYIIRRLIIAVLILLLISIFSFLLVHMLPGDPAQVMLGPEATPKQIQELRQELWLDRPVAIQYIHWLGNAIHGDFGKAVSYGGQKTTELLATKIPITLNLSILALLMSTILGIGMGIISAVRRGGILDQVVSFLANFGVAVPTFWLGILGIYLFGLKLGWLPVMGYTSPLEDFSKSTLQLIMPVICMAVPGIAVMARQTRSSMLEVVQQAYIRTASAKGLKESKIIYKHALKNALIPVVTMLGMQLRMLVGGSVLIENVFTINGMGNLMVLSVFNKDYIVVQAITMVIAVVVVLGNLIVDISYSWLDPRIRYD
jgi:peptide/nickel transport system permease protein